MTKHSFYQGCKDLKTDKDYIVDYYIKGKHKERNTFIKLELGCTRYNKIFLEQVNDLCSKFTNMITCECVIISLANKYIENNLSNTDIIQGMVRNIFGLMTAQKGTRNFLRSLKDSLLIYKIKHQDVYNSLKYVLDKRYTYYERNRKLLDDFFIDYGFTDLVEFFKATKNCTIYEDIENYRQTCFSDTSEFSDKFFELFEQAYIEYLNLLAEQNNFNLYTSISNAAQINYQHYELVKEKNKKEKLEEKLTAKFKCGKDLLDMYFSDLMITLEKGEAFGLVHIRNKDIGDICCRVKDFKNNAYFLVTAHGRTPMFFTKDGTYSTSLAKAYFVEDENLLLEEKTKALNNRIYADIFSIFAPNYRSYVTEKLSYEHKSKIEATDLERNINIALETNNTCNFSASSLCSIENKLASVKSGKIIVVKEYLKELKYYTGKDTKLTYDISKAAIYDSNVDLTNFLDVLKNNIKDSNVYSLNVTSHDIIREIGCQKLKVTYSNFLKYYIPSPRQHFNSNKTYCLFLQYNPDTNNVSTCKYSMSLNQFNVVDRVYTLGKLDCIFNFSVVNLYEKSTWLIENFNKYAEDNPKYIYQMFVLSKEQIEAINARKL